MDQVPDANITTASLNPNQMDLDTEPESIGVGDDNTATPAITYPTITGFKSVTIPSHYLQVEGGESIAEWDQTQAQEVHYVWSADEVRKLYEKLDTLEKKLHEEENQGIQILKALEKIALLEAKVSEMGKDNRRHETASSKIPIDQIGENSWIDVKSDEESEQDDDGNGDEANQQFDEDQNITNSVKFQCSSCPKTFSYKKGLSFHTFDHIIPNPYKCLTCDERFGRISSLTEHIRTNHSDEGGGGGSVAPRLHCTICTDQFNRKKALYKHCRINHSDLFKDHNCDQCGKSFCRAVDLAAHCAEIHTQPDENYGPAATKFFFCVKCDKSFSRSSNLRSHLRTVHKEAVRRTNDTGVSTHPCPECQKVFKKKQLMLAHLPACRGLKIFQCEECGLSLKHRSTLIAHRSNVHRHLRRFTCDQCGKEFFGTTNFKRHIALHSGLRPFKCSLCPSSFATEATARKHEKSHRAEFSCSHCDRKFKYKYVLDQHVFRSHSDSYVQKKAVCDLCGKHFASNRNLAAHKRNHELGKVKLKSSKTSTSHEGQQETSTRESVQVEQISEPVIGGIVLENEDNFEVVLVLDNSVVEGKK